MVLASTDITDLDKLAQLADKIIEVAAPQINATTTTSSPSEIQQLHSEISEMKRMVQFSTRHNNGIARRLDQVVPHNTAVTDL